jgi:hypothetical protein
MNRTKTKDEYRRNISRVAHIVVCYYSNNFVQNKFTTQNLKDLTLNDTGCFCLESK